MTVANWRARFPPRGSCQGTLSPDTPWDLAHSALKNCIHKIGSGSMRTAGRRKGATQGCDSSRRVSARENCTGGRFQAPQPLPLHLLGGDLAA